jgi:hypothetical protein
MPPHMQLTMTTPDEVFEALSNHRRRALIALLDDNRNGVELRTLANQIAAHEAREDNTHTNQKNAEQAVYVALYQSHVPKLEQLDIIETEQRGTGQGGHYVWPGPEFDRVLSTLKAAEGDCDGTITDRLRDLL